MSLHGKKKTQLIKCKHCQNHYNHNKYPCQHCYVYGCQKQAQYTNKVQTETKQHCDSECEGQQSTQLSPLSYLSKISDSTNNWFSTFSLANYIKKSHFNHQRGSCKSSQQFYYVHMLNLIYIYNRISTHAPPKLEKQVIMDCNPQTEHEKFFFSNATLYVEVDNLVKYKHFMSIFNKILHEILKAFVRVH